MALVVGTSLAAPAKDHVPISRFLEAASPDAKVSAHALEEIRAGWRDSYVALLIDVARFLRPPRGSTTGAEDLGSFPTDGEREGARSAQSGIPDRGSPVRRRLIHFLERQTGKRLGENLDRWRAWVWSQPYEPHPDYAMLKRTVYGQIDPRMRAFFPDGVPSRIRLDQIDWGGVTVNGIPPLRSPKVLSASEASYLKDGNIVFGLVVNGEARAYPKRILAWHEMALDRLGGVDLTIVYCTLCGTVVPYESEVAGRKLRFGTSGLLHQSNKLMFDEETNSLWSTFRGEPVVGSLVGSGISLRSLPVVTTPWGAWRAEHPETTVLSLDTGYERDYSEGAAYRDYFASDRPMFPVARSDHRLRDKDEVLVLQLPAAAPTNAILPVAIDLRFLRKHPVYSFSAGSSRYVVITSASGANRVYRLDRAIPEQPAGPTVIDAEGRRYHVTEDALVSESGAERGPRVPAHRAFWFGWFAQYPETLLIR